MLNDNVFKVDFFRLAVLMIPTKWRTSIHIAWIKVLATPFDYLLQDLRKHRSESVYKLLHDGRIGKLEKVLNDGFDQIERRIKIGEGERKQEIYSFYPTENKDPLYTSFFTFYPEELAQFAGDFEILVPVAVGLTQTELNRMKSLVDYYADKDKHFIIKEI